MTTEDFGTCLDVIKGIQDTVVFYMKMGNLDNGTGEMKRWGGGGGREKGITKNASKGVPLHKAQNHLGRASLNSTLKVGNKRKWCKSPFTSAFSYSKDHMLKNKTVLPNKHLFQLQLHF